MIATTAAPDSQPNLLAILTGLLAVGRLHPPESAAPSPRRRPRTKPPTATIATTAPHRLGKQAAAAEFNARLLEALAGLPSATPTVAELAAAMGTLPGLIKSPIDALERKGRVECWPDPDRPGVVRVMLSERSARRVGVVLGPRGDRWIPAAAAAPIAGRRGGHLAGRIGVPRRPA